MSSIPDYYTLIIDKNFTSSSLSKAKDDYGDSTKGLAQEEIPAEYQIRISDNEIEKHVERALQLARAICNDNPIDAGTALLAAIYLSNQKDYKSEAFLKIKFILKGVSLDILKNIKPTQVSRYMLNRHLGAVLKYIFDQLRQGSIVSFWGRDYIASAILCTDDPSLQELVHKAATNITQLQDKWYRFLTSSSLKKDINYNSWWEEFEVPLPKDRNLRTGYLAESVNIDDKLGIENETRAFAYLVADKKTKPPFSIGLIGDWGSGKSFFMKNMQKHVDKLIGSPGYCENIAQIDFNAWHVSDANLWASVVDHIFTGIWKKMNLEEDDREKDRMKVNDKLKEAKGALFEAERELKNKYKALQQAQKEQILLNKKYAINQYITDKRKETLSSLAKLIGWEKPLESVRNLDMSFKELRNSSQRIYSILSTALKGKTLLSSLPWISIIIILACLLFICGNRFEFEFLRDFTKIIASVGGIAGSILSAILVPIQKANVNVKKFVDELESTLNEYENNAPLKNRLVSCTTEYQLIQDRVTQLRDGIAKLEEVKSNLDPSKLLISFIEQRAHSETYRSQQGIISLVRRDFEKLSELMTDWNKNGKDFPKKIKPVDRILLYVDDLDRCSHEKVVQTLEVIHLLLALDLFIVIVGVDSRWLLRSLDVQYGKLLSSSSDQDENYRISTPQNYLEKIFQVTFALSSMEKEGFRQYIQYLTGDDAINPPEKKEIKYDQEIDLKKTGTPKQTSKEKKSITRDDEIPAKNVRNNIDGSISSVQKEILGKNILKENEAIRVYSIQEPEQKYSQLLFPLIQTPRIAKRIANVYRLIKTLASLNDLEEIEKENGRHRPILMLLAVLYDFPQISELLFRNLSERTIIGSS